MFVYAALGHKQSEGTSNSAGRGNSGDLINAKDSVIHKGDVHYHEAGLSQEEMERRFKALESKIDLSGGIMVNGERVGPALPKLKLTVTGSEMPILILRLGQWSVYASGTPSVIVWLEPVMKFAPR
jgi:hypothetical protein